MQIKIPKLSQVVSLETDKKSIVRRILSGYDKNPHQPNITAIINLLNLLQRFFLTNLMFLFPVVL